MSSGAPHQHTLSVVVPIYNEAPTARRALDAITAKQIPGWSIEIIIVESNSNDGTRAIVESYRCLPSVTLIFQDRARGKGHAVRAGFTRASGEILLIQDADLEYDLNDYESLLQPIVEGATAFTLGSRHTLCSWKVRHFERQPVRAWILNAVHLLFTALINVSLNLRLKDPFTMYKVFRRDCLKDLTFTCNRFDFDWELLIKLVRKGYRPIEIPISYRSRSFAEGKKISIFRDPVTWLWAFVKCRFGRL